MRRRGPSVKVEEFSGKDIEHAFDVSNEPASSLDLEWKTNRAESVKKDLQRQKTEGGVFNYDTLQCVGKLGAQGHIDQIKGPISTGKEADVFMGYRGEGKIAIKIYRLNSASYFRNPTVLEYILGDERFRKIKQTPRDLIHCWSMKEFRNLKKAEEAKVRAPRPIAVEKNVLVMDFIGDETAAPPLLRYPMGDPEGMFKEIISQVKRLYKNDLVHADLSEYNILVNDGKPVLIDFGQGVLLSHPKAMEFLERDIKNICYYFKRKGVSSDPKKVLKGILGKKPKVKEEEEKED